MKSKNFVIVLRKIFQYLLVISLIGSLGYVYFKTGTFTIKNYQIIGVKEEYQENILNLLKEISNHKIYKILPGNRTVSFHSKNMKKGILEILPNTATISIYPSSFKTLKILIVPFTPLFRVGENEAITKDAEIYSEIEDISKLPIISFSTSTLITKEKLALISGIIPKINVGIFEVKKIYIDEYDDIYLYGGRREKSAIIFSSFSDGKKIWSNLVSAIDTEPLKSKLEDEKHNLLYLDVRFGNKVFYKFTKFAEGDIIQDHDFNQTSSTTISN